MIVITTMESLPDHCHECPCQDVETGRYQADKERIYSDYRPYWCPLKEQDNCENCAIAIEDRQPVVRCKDCKHRDPEDGRCDSGHDIRWNLPRQDDWFCADGIRRKET